MKAHIRKNVKQALAAMSPEAAAAKSRTICESILATDEYRRARAVMLYAPIPGEVDVVPLAEAAWRDGKTVLVPRVDWETHQMVAVPIESMDELTEVDYGLREPADGEPWPVERIDLLIVPALAFDAAGNRLGRGGGFYDRFLARKGNHAIPCGIAFLEQVLDDVPVGRYDRPVRMLVTDAGIRRFD